MFKIYLLPVIALLFSIVSSAQTFTGTGGDIPDDGTTIIYDLPVNNLAGALNTTNFGLVSVCINLTHTWDSDLSISLRAPDGSTIVLFSDIGGDQDGFLNTCLSGNETASIFTANYPFTGTFRPFGDMGTLNNGQNPNGVWQLVILDTYAFADAGELFNWSITFGTNPCKPFIFTSSDLPILVIDSDGQEIVDEPKINAELRIIDNGPGQRNELQQMTSAYTGFMGIELHGNSTLRFPKKSYGLEIRDTTGEEIDTVLLHLPATSDFILSANFSDKTLLRNALTYELARRTGHYATRTRFCEVVVNGTYQGVYVLTEKIKRGADRVNINKMNETDTTGKKLTGGYLVRIDRDESPGWYSQFSQPNIPDRFTYFQNEYPKPDNIHPLQKAYIQTYVDSFEVALQGVDFQDSTIGWRHFMDEKSCMDYIFMNELSRNVDAYRLSTYFYKDRNEKMAMGPVWDYDLAWYNADYCAAYQSDGWAYNLNYACGDGGVPFWWERLFADTLFSQNAACRWEALRATTLSQDSIFAAIDSMTAVVQEAQARNFQYWPILGAYVWPNPGTLPTTYTGEIEKMKNWITERLAWLDFAFGENAPALNAEFVATSTGTLDWQFQAAAGNSLHFAWDFDDGSTSELMNPIHHFNSPGTYSVHLTVSTPFGCSVTTEQVIQIINTSIYDIAVGDLRVFPNPTAGSLHVTMPEALTEPFSLQFSNSLGETVLKRDFNAAEKSVLLALDALPAGMYAVELRSSMNRWATRVMITH